MGRQVVEDRAVLSRAELREAAMTLGRLVAAIDRGEMDAPASVRHRLDGVRLGLLVAATGRVPSVDELLTNSIQDTTV
ncbi:MAG: hypothetical protein ACYCU5_13240 [Actinomycetes bacterium]